MIRSLRTGRLVLAVALLTACGSAQGSAGALAPPSPVAAASVTSTAARTFAPHSAGPTAVRAGQFRPARDGVPRFAHIVVVVLENKPYGELVGTGHTPFLTRLAAAGAVLTHSYAITHPSEPNYLALFAGTTHGLSSDSCPHTFTGPNLASSIISPGGTFVGYSESLPSVGYTGCRSGSYARKHNPWVNFPGLKPSVSQPMTAFPTNLAQLPDLAFVIPNLDDDMHDGSVAQGDRWLSTHLGAYVSWMTVHHSLLIVTTDEDDNHHANHITTIVAGAQVTAGRYAARTDHYGLLRTMLDSFGLSPFAAARTAIPVTAIWHH